MNKIWLFGAAVCMVLALGSCKPKQSAYKAARSLYTIPS